MINAAIVGLLMQAPASAAIGTDPLEALAGTWQVVNIETGEVTTDCANPQNFAVSADRRTATLTDTRSGEQLARYLVLHSDRGRILMFIEGETRTTRSGDPVLWYAQFNGPDRFQWRRYDWRRSQRTAGEWRRCPRG